VRLYDAGLESQAGARIASAFEFCNGNVLLSILTACTVQLRYDSKSLKGVAPLRPWSLNWNDL
jgi:hypothetical protein